MSSRDRDRLLALALRVATQPPRSLDELSDISAVFVELNPELPGYEDFEMALALFSPGGGGEQNLLDESGLQSAARELLHDLCDHRLCLHEVPLAERP